MTQNEIVLAALRRGGWWSMQELARQSRCLTIHSRIAELRKRGHVILNRQDNLLGDDGRRVRGSWYWLEVDKEDLVPNAQLSTLNPQPSLA